MRYKIWDKISPIKNYSAEEYMEKSGITFYDEVYIIIDDEGEDYIVETFNSSPYDGYTIEEKVKNHLRAIENGWSYEDDFDEYFSDDWEI